MTTNGYLPNDCYSAAIVGLGSLPGVYPMMMWELVLFWTMILLNSVTLAALVAYVIYDGLHSPK